MISQTNSSYSDTRRIAQSIVRYRKDFRSFAVEQLRLGGRNLDFWPCQIPLIEGIERQMEERGFARVVWLKARQVGASTLAQAVVAWRTFLWPNTNSIVIADENERAKALFNISKSFYENLDEDIKPMGRYATKSELVLANPSSVTRRSDPGLRSRIVVDSAAKKNIAIGARWDVAHLSEAARYPGEGKLVLDGIIPAVHRIPGTIVIIESSAEMAGTWYRDFCEESARKQNAFEFTFVPWFLQPEYFICPVCFRGFNPATGLEMCEDLIEHGRVAERYIDLTGDERHIMTEFGLRPGHIQWMREKLMEMGNDWDLFRQSYPLTADDAWVIPGMQGFSYKHLREQKRNILAPIRRADVHVGPSVLSSMMGRLWIWEEPQMGKVYDIGVDVAQGLGKDEDPHEDGRDNTVACVLERGSNKQVAEWVSKAIDPFELATHLYWLGMYYNQAQVAVEVNNIGGGTNNQLAKLGYPNIYMWRYRDEAVPRYSKKTGWETSPKSKAWLVGFSNHELINGRFIVRSELLWKEMDTYMRLSAREWGAAPGNKDDRVQAFMIALIASDDENFEKYYGLSRTTGTNTPKIVLPEPWQADLTWGKHTVQRDIDPWK